MIDKLCPNMKIMQIIERNKNEKEDDDDDDDDGKKR